MRQLLESARLLRAVVDHTQGKTSDVAQGWLLQRMRCILRLTSSLTERKVTVVANDLRSTELLALKRIDVEV